MNTNTLFVFAKKYNYNNIKEYRQLKAGVIF